MRPWLSGIAQLNNSLKLSQKFGMVLCKMMDNAHILNEAADVASRKNEIEMIDAEALLDHPEFTIHVRGFSLHVFYLLVAQASDRLPLLTDKLILWRGCD